MNLKSLFKRRKVWAIALYKLQCESEIFKIDEHEPFHFLGERGIRKNTGYQATTADPFLFSHGDRLYLFYEVQTDFGVGEIWAQSMDPHGAWTCHGQVLKEKFHLSYPQVFSHAGRIWMIPEAAASGKVWLYESQNWPCSWRRSRVLIDEPLLDPSVVIKQEGVYLLCTTRAYELRIYFSPDLNSDFVSTGITISKDRAVARNAGRPISVQGVLYRFAQNCRNAYGENISVLQITHLSVDKYVEQVKATDLYQSKPRWMEAGYHHISSAPFLGQYFVAVDGMRRDKYLNTLLLAFLKMFRGPK